MRVIVLVKATREYEAGATPDRKLLERMGTFNEELVNAGVMLDGQGLRPSSSGKRIQYGKGTPRVIDGPFTETKELVAGFWIWQVKSMDEAVQWLKRAPFEPGDTVEIRPFYELADFGEEFTPELQERENRLRERLK